MALINMMEEIVSNEVEKLVKDSEICDNEDCINDIMAIALNSLPPKYVNTSKGELFARADSLLSQHLVDVQIAVLKAIEIVKCNPRKTN